MTENNSKSFKIVDSQSTMIYWKVKYASLSSKGEPFVGEALIIAHNSVKDWQIVECLKSDGRHTTTYDMEKINGKYVSTWKIKNDASTY